METIYKESVGSGRYWFFVYSDGRRIQVSRAWALKAIARGARVVNI